MVAGLACAADPPPSPPPAPPPDDEVVPTGTVTVDIDATADRVAVSPWIYGMNTLRDPALDRQGLVRMGGNRFTAWNWENNASNAGNDLNFQSDGYLGGGDVPGGAVAQTLGTALPAGLAAVVTVPMVDDVAADKAGGSVFASGEDYLAKRFKANRATNPAGPQVNPNRSDGFVYQDDFVAWAKATTAAKAGSGVLGFSLDNEPDLWSSTHREVHPTPVTYAELLDRTLRFSRMIKAAWPTAPVFGFASYGWNGFMTLQNAPDRAGRAFLPFFLDGVRAAEDADGIRLVDFLDLHWYPEARGPNAAGVDTRIVAFSAAANDDSPGVVAARLGAPRSLWDPSYVEKSWISTSLNGEPIALIPRLEAILDAHAPGMKLAFMEWNYGGGGHISGALATADVLGIFGRTGVGAAAFWPIGGESYSFAAFRAYRNYDGAGSAFGDTQVRAVSSRATDVSAYASVDASDPGRLVLVLVNKADEDLAASIRIVGAGPWALARSYRVSSLGPRVRTSVVVTAGPDGSFSYPLPRRSLSVLAWAEH